MQRIRRRRVVHQELSENGGGYDYLLTPLANNGRDDQNFFAVSTHRLEVSGILKDTDGDIAARMREKVKRLNARNHSLPAYVIIVGFGTVTLHIGLTRP